MARRRGSGQCTEPRCGVRPRDHAGAFDSRTRFACEILEDARDAVGSRAAVAIRIEVTDPDGSGAGARAEFPGRIAPLVDVFDATIPDDPVEMRPSRFVRGGCLEDRVARVRRATGRPAVSVGRFTSPETMLSQLRRGVLDFIGAARPSIADPFLPAKIRDGRMEDIRECTGCNICCAHHRLAAPICCTQNPTMGKEWRRGWHPEKVPALVGQAGPVLIAGAGPAGLEAGLPGLSERGRVVDRRLSQLAKLPQVTLYPGSRMAAEDIPETGLRDRGPARLVWTGDPLAPGLIAHAVHDGHAAARGHLSPPGPQRRERPVLAR